MPAETGILIATLNFQVKNWQQCEFHHWEMVKKIIIKVICETLGNSTKDIERIPRCVMSTQNIQYNPNLIYVK